MKMSSEGDGIKLIYFLLKMDTVNDRIDTRLLDNKKIIFIIQQKCAIIYLYIFICN